MSDLRALRIYVAIFIAGLFLSGVTGFPLETELRGFVHLLLQQPALERLAARHISWHGSHVCWRR